MTRSRKTGLHRFTGKTLWMAMKLTVFLLTAAFLSVQAVGSRAQTITLSGKDISLKHVFATIKKQTGYLVFGNTDLLKSGKAVSLSAQDVPLQEFLGMISKDQPFSCEIKSKTIMLIQNSSPHPSGNVMADNRTDTGTISGFVRNDKGEPLIGTTIAIKNSKQAAVTNERGAFRLGGVREGSVLIITNIGFKSQSVTVQDIRKIMEIVLEKNISSLSEVVVNTGIVNRNANSFTGAATTITREDLARVSNKNVIQSLKVLEPSLMIFSNLTAGSDPNKLPDMMLRGNSSFPQGAATTNLKGDYGNNPNQPLFILDGFEVSLTKVVDLDMNRIETITILKDASAKAIYGAKAANGVVVIETKKNTGNKAIITYNGSVDIETPDLSSYNLANSAEKLEAERIYGMYSQISDYPPNYQTQLQLDQQYNQRLQAVLSGVNTDWMSKPLRNGLGQKHGISVELGERDLKLFADFSYNNIAGVMKGSARNVFATSATLSYRYKNFLFRNILSFTDGKSNDSPYGTFGEYAKMNPYWTPYDEFGNLKQNAETGIVPYVGSTSISNFYAPNPLYNSTLNTKLTNNYTEFIDNFYTEVNLMTGLKMLLRGSFTSTKNQADQFYPANHLKFQNYTGDDFFRKGSYQRNEGAQVRYTGDFNVNYNKPLGDKHLLFLNVGANVSERSFEEVAYSAEGFPNDRMNDILFAKQYSKYANRPTGSEGTTRDLGFLSIASYSFDNRFFADASFRTSASSQFGENHRWGSFWSTGLGWNIQNEKWIENLNIFDRLKLRASVGSTGSQNFSSYQSLATYTYFQDKIYQGYLGAYLKGLANPDLRWQQKMDYNVGIDFNIRKRFTGRLDYYQSITQNTLVDFTLPPSTGFFSVKENLGKIRNIGLEAMLSYTIYSDTRNRSYFSVTASAIHNKNTIVSISNALDAYNQQQNKMAEDRFNNTPVVKYYNGVSMDAIWAVRSLGIDPANGQEIYLTKNGVKTYTYSGTDQVVVGDKMPKVSGTFGLNGEYRGFGMNAYFTFLCGGQLYNQTLVDRVENVDMSYNVDKRVLNSTWHQPGDVKPFKALGSVEIQNPDGSWTRKFIRTQPSDRFVMDRNELSLASLSFTYDFYRWAFVKQMGLQRLRCAFYTNDLFTLSSIPVERGTDYPFSRKFSFSLSATF
ncbi:SusC/RagA family TonB-linked outer membrane protein [Chitinophaga eiseniae]|uniref:SusC/RagA family TonB-linked outer membrane protein n=1 Tax=Chitinophaga eiseniae TaxID=634771 RepID=A0A847SSN4_9BACT|nr:SusC/RagA family TonB-linked outer membrane protein [Chitinophaga eiseniae]NLR80429.1 SusC/RagA family TonB-linked outer membrane protein [Chitinophaga eiseniae]